MIRSSPPAKVLLVLCLALLAGRPASAADPARVDAAKRWLSDTDRSKGILFFAHPTATYRSYAVQEVNNGTGVTASFSITMRYSWKSLFDDTNTSDLMFCFNGAGRLTEIQLGKTTSFFPQFTGGDVVLNALKDELEKKVDEWDDAAAQRTARALIRRADTRGLLTLLLQNDQP